MLTTVLVDYKNLSRQSLKVLLESAGIEVVGEACDGRTAVNVVDECRPQIAVLDVFLPLLNGLDASRKILEISPETKIVLLARYTTPEHVREALSAGVSSYVLKSASPSTLIRAIREAVSGTTYVDPVTASTLSGPVTTGRGPFLAGPLTLRQREILQLICEGKICKEVAGILGISPKTAESHRQRIADRLNLRNTAEFVRYAVRHNIITAGGRTPVLRSGRLQQAAVAVAMGQSCA